MVTSQSYKLYPPSVIITEFEIYAFISNYNYSNKKN